MEKKEFEIITRKEALAKGLKNYYTGKKCKHGHRALRIANSGSCKECLRLATKRWRAEGGIKSGRKVSGGKRLPPLEILQEIFTYEEVSGKLFWKERDASHFKTHRGYKVFDSKFAGKEAGHHHHVNKYVEVRFDGKLYKGHRIVWKLHTGEDPKELIDHVDGNPENNRFSNLREATAQDNARNAKRSTATKYKGVVSNKDNTKFKASYAVGDVPYYSDSFDTEDEAALWYNEKVSELFGEFAKLNIIGEEDE